MNNEEARSKLRKVSTFWPGKEGWWHGAHAIPEPYGQIIVKALIEMKDGRMQLIPVDAITFVDEFPSEPKELE